MLKYLLMLNEITIKYQSMYIPFTISKQNRSILLETKRKKAKKKYHLSVYINVRKKKKKKKEKSF